jgi:YfiH family protein
MLRKECDGVQWLEFELFSDCRKLKHGVFTRHGGVSSDSFSSLNVSSSVGDDPQKTAINRQKIEKIIGSPLTRINMCHGKIVKIIEEFPYTTNPVCDAIATHLPHIGLMITHGDCQAAIFYDPIKHVVANAHSGWRGSVQNIYGEVIKQMKERYGCCPRNLLVGIAPSLGPQRSEFINYRTELPEHFLKYQVKPAYFDFWHISADQLLESGVLPNHIQIAGICTYEHEGDFYSYRRDKKAGRNATVASLI